MQRSSPENRLMGQAGPDQMNAVGSWLDENMTTLRIAAAVLIIGATAALFYVLPQT
jgi:hypothetical protein